MCVYRVVGSIASIARRRNDATTQFLLLAPNLFAIVGNPARVLYEVSDY